MVPVKTKSFVQLVGLSALWGATFLLTRITAPVFGANLAAGLRILLGAATLAAIMFFAKEPWPKNRWPNLFILGALAVAGPHLFYSWSALSLPASYGSVVSVTSVLFGTFASAWLKEDVLSARKLMGCLFGFAGVALVVRLGPVEPSPALLAGAMACTTGAFFSGIATPFLKRATTHMQPLAITAGMHLTGSIILMPFALWSLPTASFSLSAMLAVMTTGILTSGLAYWQYMRIMREVSPVAVLSATFMVTGFGVLWAFLFLNEPLSLITWIGALLVVIATVMVSGINPWRRQPRP
jgi:drug/metabolite transporter (DMT)-like permease